MLLEAALNGTRTRSEHPAVPVTPDQLARDAAAAVLCGAEAVHVHVRGRDEHESLDPDDVARTVEAIRSACPNIPIGISTGAWIVPDLRDRLRLPIFFHHKVISGQIRYVPSFFVRHCSDDVHQRHVDLQLRSEN